MAMMIKGIIKGNSREHVIEEQHLPE